jgi:hypothetical protein
MENKMSDDSILDRLNDDADDDDGNVIHAESQDSEEIIIPRLCAFCKTNTVCSVLPTFVSMSKIGIVIGLEKCPFHNKK